MIKKKIGEISTLVIQQHSSTGKVHYYAIYVHSFGNFNQSQLSAVGLRAIIRNHKWKIMAATVEAQAMLRVLSLSFWRWR